MKTILNISLMSLILSIDGFAQSPQNDPTKPIVIGSKEQLRNMIVSRLDPLLKKLSLKRENLSIEDIKNLMKNQKTSFYGTVHDVDRFFTLKDLCEIVKTHPEREKLKVFLRDEIKRLDAWSDKSPGNWNESIGHSAGGSVGVLIAHYLDMSQVNEVSTLFRSILEDNKHLKVKVFLTQVRVNGLGDKYIESIKGEITNYTTNKAPSPEMSSVLATQIEKIEKYIDKKKKKEAEQ